MTNLFDQNTTPSFDDNKDYLEELVGEGKKFKDAQALAKGKAESDAFIESLKREQAQLRDEYLRLREEYNAVPRLQELVDQLSNTQLPPSDNNPPNDGIPPAIKPEDIENLVSQKINESKVREKEESNYREVQAKLRERFGDNYPIALKSQIESLGLTEDFVNDLARRHPAVFYKTFGLENQNNKDLFQAPPPSTARVFSPSNRKRDWTYYEELRTKQPTVYWDPKTQVQLHKDYAEQGDAFGMPG